MTDQQQRGQYLCGICGETATHEVLIPVLLSVWCRLCDRCKKHYNSPPEFTKLINIATLHPPDDLL